MGDHKKREQEQRYRRVSTRIWNDRKFRTLGRPEKPNAQHLFFYLLTNPATSSIPGLFRAREVALADDLGWTLKGFRACFDELAAQGMAEADWEAGLVWLPNAVKHDRPANPNVIKSWAKVVRSDLPECELLYRALLHIAKEVADDTESAWAAEALRQHFTEPLWKGLRESFAEPFVKRLGESRTNLQIPEPLPDPDPDTTTTSREISAGADWAVTEEPRDAFPGDCVTVRRCRWRPTADGCWGWIQFQRMESDLSPEGARPDAFGSWFALALQEVGQEGIETAWLRYRRDLSIKATEWPTAVFILPAVFDVRAPKRKAAS